MIISAAASAAWGEAQEINLNATPRSQVGFPVSLVDTVLKCSLAVLNAHWDGAFLIYSQDNGSFRESFSDILHRIGIKRGRVPLSLLYREPRLLADARLPLRTGAPAGESLTKRKVNDFSRCVRLSTMVQKGTSNVTRQLFSQSGAARSGTDKDSGDDEGDT
jgi:hypothetical protein